MLALRHLYTETMCGIAIAIVFVTAGPVPLDIPTTSTMLQCSNETFRPNNHSAFNNKLP